MKPQRSKTESTTVPAPATNDAKVAPTAAASGKLLIRVKGGAKPGNVEPEVAAASAEMVTVVKVATAAKLSPRGDGELTYQVGRVGETVLVRILSNPSAGRFSKEWVAVEAIRSALARLPKDAPLFKGALALKSAWKGKSSCNAGFGAAILKAEGLFVADAEKKGMMSLASATALDDWEKAMRALKVPRDAEKVPLHPPKPVPNFSKRVPAAASVSAKADDTQGGLTADEKASPEDAAPAEDGGAGAATDDPPAKAEDA